MKKVYVSKSNTKAQKRVKPKVESPRHAIKAAKSHDAAIVRAKKHPKVSELHTKPPKVVKEVMQSPVHAIEEMLIEKEVLKEEAIQIIPVAEIEATNKAIENIEKQEEIKEQLEELTPTQEISKFATKMMSLARTKKFDRNYVEPGVVAEVKDLTLSFKVATGGNKLVIRNTSFKLYEGEVLAVIGESGSGKTVITTALMGLLGNNAIFESGQVIVDGVDVTNFSTRDWEKSKIRGKIVSSVFQNPMTTLNPTMKIGKQIMETALVNKITKDKKEAYAMALELLTKVKMPNPELIMEMYPHELSGGMKQRVVIAAVLMARPKILILDEPTTALDPTVQAETLRLIIDLQKEFKTSIIFITHDLGVVASIADRIAIMYAGKVVEIGPKVDVLWNSKHPYTWGLLSSMPDINIGDRLYSIPGSVPSSLNFIKGDAFAPRNLYALEIDFKEHPPFFAITEKHFVASWLYHPDAPDFTPPAPILKRWVAFEKGLTNGKNRK